MSILKFKILGSDTNPEIAGSKFEMNGKTAEKEKRVTEEEFHAFLSSYPRRLEVDICGISEPPLITYNDFSGGKIWPDSVVARTFRYDKNPGDYFYEAPENREYYVKDM